LHLVGCNSETDIQFFIKSRSDLLRMKNVAEKKICRENQDTRFITNDFFENRAVYEIMWKNIVQPDRPQMTPWRMRIA